MYYIFEETVAQQNVQSSISSAVEWSGSCDKTSFFLTYFRWKLEYHKTWYLIYNSILILNNFDTKMSLNNIEKVWTSLLDAQSMEMQNLEEEDDVNMQQKSNTSTCSVCNKEATGKYISCSEYHIQIHYRCTFLPSYHLYYFVETLNKQQTETLNKQGHRYQR